MGNIECHNRRRPFKLSSKALANIALKIWGGAEKSCNMLTEGRNDNC